MSKYWPAECLSVSCRLFSYEQVCEISRSVKLMPEHVAVKQYRVRGNKVYRLFHVPVIYQVRIEAYAAAGQMVGRIMAEGPKVKGMGQVVVLEDFVKPYQNMHKHKDW